MILVGQYDSPFVRRVAVSLRVVGFAYEHDTRSVFGDFDSMLKVNPLGRIPALNWITYHAKTGKYDVKLELDERSAARKDPFGRKSYRFQIQGPNAAKVIEAATGAPMPDVKFYNMNYVTIAGKTVPEFDHLNVTGHVTLDMGSKLELDFINGFAPKMGDKFDFLQSGDAVITDRRRCVSE